MSSVLRWYEEGLGCGALYSGSLRLFVATDRSETSSKECEDQQTFQVK